MALSEFDTKTKSRTQRPQRYTAVFVNDDYTPMDFVMEIMMRIFKLSTDEAAALTMDIHNKGRGNTGLFTREVAETKCDMAMEEARAHEFPFRCVVEPA